MFWWLGIVKKNVNPYTYLNVNFDLNVEISRKVKKNKDTLIPYKTEKKILRQD